MVHTKKTGGESIFLSRHVTLVTLCVLPHCMALPKNARGYRTASVDL